MRGVLFGAVVALLLVGCESSSSSESAPIEGFPPGYAADASEFEKEILADGEVTYAEYERANLSIVDCLEDNGVQATEVLPASEDGFLNFNFVRPDDPAEQRRVEAFFADCEKQYAQYVFAVYWKQNLPSGEELADRKELLLECLDEAGLTGLSDDPTTTELAERFFIHGDDLTVEQVDCFFEYETVLHSEEE